VCATVLAQEPLNRGLITSMLLERLGSQLELRVGVLLVHEGFISRVVVGLGMSEWGLESRAMSEGLIFNLTFLKHLLPGYGLFGRGKNCRRASFICLPVFGGALKIKFTGLNPRPAASLRLIFHVLRAG
jgi:hypothetical protein